MPDVWIVDTEGTPAVWKTWWRRPKLERMIFGKWFAFREGKILRRLSKMEGFPRFLSNPDPCTLEMTLLLAEPVPEEKHGKSISSLYFKRLEKMLQKMHKEGINHGDLRRKNLLRAPNDPHTPLMVDFTQCLCFTPPIRGLRRLIMKEAIRIDQTTVAKLKKWFLGDEALSDQDFKALGDVPWHLYLGRFLRKKIYRPFKHWRRRKAKN